MSSSKPTRWCPVCENGIVGYCDERCETREPNGQPGHFPGQVPIVMRNAPSVDDAVLQAERISTWRRFDAQSLAHHPAGTCDGCGNDAVELCTWLEDGGAANDMRLSYCRPCMGDDAGDPSNVWVVGEAI